MDSVPAGIRAVMHDKRYTWSKRKSFSLRIARHCCRVVKIDIELVLLAVTETRIACYKKYVKSGISLRL